MNIIISFDEFLTEELKRVISKSSKTGRTIETDIIHDDIPSSSKSLSSGILLKDELKRKEEDELMDILGDTTDFSKINSEIKDHPLAVTFNNLQFLKDREKELGTLRCEYCHKGPLKIYDFNPDKINGSDLKNKRFRFSDVRFNPRDGATCDHKEPMSKGGDKFDYENLAVCCHRCNQKKDDMSWDRWVKSMSLKEQFTHKMKNGYVEFDSTYNSNVVFDLGNIAQLTDCINSYDDFRDTHKRISPSEKLKNDIIKIVSDKIGHSLDHMEWDEKFRQLYVYMWPNVSAMSFSDREKSNRKTLIIDFYEDEWIFCAICDKNLFETFEKHFVCDYTHGFEKFLDDQKDYLTTKQ